MHLCRGGVKYKDMNSFSGRQGFILPLILIILGSLAAVGAGVGVAVYVHRDQNLTVSALEVALESAPAPAPMSVSVAGSASSSLPGTPKKDGVIIAFQTKTNFAVGEPVPNLKFSVQNIGDSFTGVVIVRQPGDGLTLDRLFNNFSVSQGVNSQPAGSSFGISGDILFQKEEAMDIVVSVYKCVDIEKVLGANCGGKTIDLVTRIRKNNITPFASNTLHVVVKGMYAPPATSERSVLSCMKLTEVYKDPKSIPQDVLATQGECLEGLTDLFVSQLSACQPSRGTAIIGFEAFLQLFRHYEIVGIKNGQCAVDFSFGFFSATPDPQAEALFSGKSMTCQYSASERTIDKVASTENCSGTLYDALQELKKIQENN